jgi:hypothetical protein
MRSQISKRLETLERAADTEVFLNALVFALAYYPGGARHVSQVPEASGRALGYHDLEELCRALAALLLGRPSDIRARAGLAQRELFAKFGYDLDPASPAALADAAYRITATLPDEWRAAIKSAHREGCELEAMADEILQTLDRAIRGESKYARRTKPRQGDRPEGK